jgi:nucleoside-diphosphate-sugar epimerase
MSKPIVVITGASGFLGSALCLDLAKDFIVIAIDRREPSATLRKAVPHIRWHILDIADLQDISAVMAQTRNDFAQIDFVIHFAAYYDFGNAWREEYQRTNVQGTANVLAASKNAGVKRLIFASSIGAMEPPNSGSVLREENPTGDFIPYARSKDLGEKLIKEACSQVPSIILRIGGVFSDWCELPPLYGLIKLWTSTFPLGRIIPGRGESGIPYIHVCDLMRAIRKCIVLHHELGSFNIFLVSQHGTVLHRQLFPAIRSAAGYSGSHRPIHVTRGIAKLGVWFQCAFGKFSGSMPYERPWMLDYVDRPWTADTSKTRRTLDWDCTPELGILRKIPDILSNLRKNPEGWEERNISRNERRYLYLGS